MFIKLYSDCKKTKTINKLKRKALKAIFRPEALIVEYHKGRLHKIKTMV